MAFFKASKINNMKTAYRNGDLEKALSYADRLLPSDVSNAYDLTMMADIYMESERYVAAKRAYAELYKKNESTRLCKQLIDLNIRTDCIEQAIKYVSELKKLDEDDYERYVYQFRIGKAMGQPDEYLIQNLLKVREADYIDVWAFELAKLFFKTGRISECETECQNIILWFPETDYARKARLLIEACHSGTNYDEIIETIPEKESELESEEETYTEIDEEDYASAVQDDDLAYTEVPPVSGAAAADDVTAYEEEYDEEEPAEYDEEEAEEYDEEEPEEYDEEAEEEPEEVEENETGDIKENSDSEAEEAATDENPMDEKPADEKPADEKPEEEPDYEEMPVYNPFDEDELPEIDFLKGAGIVLPESEEEPEEEEAEIKPEKLPERKAVKQAEKKPENKSVTEDIPVNDGPVEKKPEEVPAGPSQNTIIRDAIADEVLKALQAQEAGEVMEDAVDEKVLKMIQEDDDGKGQ